jgi:uncharacterized protein YyaL (SSP411 family)
MGKKAEIGKHENIHTYKKRIKMEGKKIMHYQLELKSKIKNNKNFINELRKKFIKIRIKLKTPAFDEKNLNM